MLKIKNYIYLLISEEIFNNLSENEINYNTFYYSIIILRNNLNLNKLSSKQLNITTNIISKINLIFGLNKEEILEIFIEFLNLKLDIFSSFFQYNLYNKNNKILNYDRF